MCKPVIMQVEPPFFPNPTQSKQLILLNLLLKLFPNKNHFFKIILYMVNSTKSKPDPCTVAFHDSPCMFVSLILLTITSKKLKENCLFIDEWLDTEQ